MVPWSGMTARFDDNQLCISGFLPNTPKKQQCHTRATWESVIQGTAGVCRWSKRVHGYEKRVHKSPLDAAAPRLRFEYQS